MSKVKKAIIPVAGLGTRMLPATKAIPKELLPVYDRPIIEHVVCEALKGGLSEIIFVTRSGKEAIENHFDVNYELEHRLEGTGKKKILGSVKNIIPESVKVSSVRQNKPLGLGHAILCAKHLIGQEPVAVLLPDVLILDQINKDLNYSFTKLMDAWNCTGLGQIMVEAVDPVKIENYGVVSVKDYPIKKFVSSKIDGLIEKPSRNNAPSNLAVIGRYILPNEIFDVLESTPKGVGEEIQLTDALDKLARTTGLNMMETDADIFDCGNKRGFLGANLAMAYRDKNMSQYISKIYKKLVK